MSTATKRCTRCHATKPLAGFSREARNRGGLRSNCKDCANACEALARAKRAAKRLAQRAEELARVARDGKACAKCGEVKPLDGFPVTARNSDGRRGVCRQCVNSARRLMYDPKRRTGKCQRCGVTYQVTAGIVPAHCSECTDIVRRAYHRAYDADKKAKRYLRFLTGAHKEAFRRWRMKDRARLSDQYVRQRLCAQLGLHAADIPPALVEKKREQMLLRRMAREIRKSIHALKENSK